MTPEAQRYLASRASKHAGVKIKRPAFSILNTRKAGTHLVTKRQYKNALNHPDGHISDLPTDEVEEMLKYKIAQSRTASKVLIGKTGPTMPRLTKDGGLVSIIYPILDMPELEYEHYELGHFIDRLNGPNVSWGSVDSEIAVSTIVEGDSRLDKFVAAFESARPEKVALTPAQVLPAVRYRY